MNKIDFKNLPDTTTQLSAENLNLLQDNVEEGIKKPGNIVVDSIKTKNIFGNYTILNAWISGTLLRVDINTGNRAAFIKCKPNTTYTITRSVITSTFRVSDYTSTPIQTNTTTDYTIPTAIENNSGTKITYTTSSTAQYLIVHYGNLSNDTASTISSSLNSIQVEEGNTETAYTPYQNLDSKEPVVLYNNQNGTQDASITLSDNIENYEYVEIYYRSSWIYGSLKIYTNKANTSKNFPLNIIYGSGTADITFMVNVYAIANNKITIADSGNRGMNGYISNGNVVSITRQNPIYILRVVGYR